MKEIITSPKKMYIYIFFFVFHLKDLNSWSIMHKISFMQQWTLVYLSKTLSLVIVYVYLVIYVVNAGSPERPSDGLL